MTTPYPPDSISMADLDDVFHRGYSLGNYYGVAPGVPASGTISFNDLRGKTATSITNIGMYFEGVDVVARIYDALRQRDGYSTGWSQVRINIVNFNPTTKRCQLQTNDGLYLADSSYVYGIGEYIVGRLYLRPASALAYHNTYFRIRKHGPGVYTLLSEWDFYRGTGASPIPYTISIDYDGALYFKNPYDDPYAEPAYFEFDPPPPDSYCI